MNNSMRSLFLFAVATILAASGPSLLAVPAPPPEATIAVYPTGLHPQDSLNVQAALDAVSSSRACRPGSRSPSTAQTPRLRATSSGLWCPSRRNWENPATGLPYVHDIRVVGTPARNIAYKGIGAVVQQTMPLKKLPDLESLGR